MSQPLLGLRAITLFGAGACCQPSIDQGLDLRGRQFRMLAAERLPAQDHACFPEIERDSQPIGEGRHRPSIAWDRQ